MKELNSNWLFFFRINVSLIALLHFASVQLDFEDFYGQNAYVYPDILDASFDHFSFTITSLAQFLQKNSLSISYRTLVTIARIAYPLFLALLLFGWFTRVAAIGSLFFQLLLIKSIHLYEYGVDYFTTISLFYCIIFPVGKVYSIDKKRRKLNGKVNHLIYLRLLKAHLGIAYFFSGFDKIIGETWRNGEAIWKALHSHNYFSLFSLDFLANTPFFLISGLSTCILELMYPVFINYNKTRKIWLIAIILLHIFIAFFMGLFFFSALLIVLNLSAYFIPYFDLKKHSSRQRAEI